MDWFAVIVGGLIAGIIAKALVGGREPGGWLIDIIIGVVGGIIGKFVLGMLNMPQYGGAIWNLIVAVIGAVILLVIYHAVSGGTRRGATTA